MAKINNTDMSHIISRSPKSYETLRSSGMLVLLSEYLLVLFRNCVNQVTGFNDEVFTWMHNDAERLGIPKDCRVGGLIIDEMAIQPNLRIVTNGATVEFVGLVETLDGSRSMKVIQQGNNAQTMATHVFQIIFLGITGFRFPIAHFPVTETTASEIHYVSPCSSLLVYMGI